MEVHVGTLTKCCLIAFLFHSACALQVDMSKCTIDVDSNQCIAYDSTSDIHYEGDNVLANMIIRLPISVLTEVLSDPRRVSIMTAGRDNVTFGEEIVREQDKATWAVQNRIEPVNDKYGSLHIKLNIAGVQYSDEQWLHVEIRTDYATFKTSDQIWFPLHNRTTNGEDTDHQQEGESTTTKDTSTTEDPVDKLKAKMGELERENKALETENKVLATENKAVLHEVIDYQKNYETCLETKNLAAHNPITLDLMTFLVLIAVTAVIVAIFAYAIFYKKNKIVSMTNSSDNPMKVKVSFEV